MFRVATKNVRFPISRNLSEDFRENTVNKCWLFLKSYKKWKKHDYFCENIFMTWDFGRILRKYLFPLSCKNICYRERFCENIRKTRALRGVRQRKKICCVCKNLNYFCEGQFTRNFSRRFKYLNNFEQVCIRNFCENLVKIYETLRKRKKFIFVSTQLMLNNVCVGIKKRNKNN